MQNYTQLKPVAVKPPKNNAKTNDTLVLNQEKPSSYLLCEGKYVRELVIQISHPFWKDVWSRSAKCDPTPAQGTSDKDRSLTFTVC